VQNKGGNQDGISELKEIQAVGESGNLSSQQ
jgi:hypothetical protein